MKAWIDILTTVCLCGAFAFLALAILVTCLRICADKARRIGGLDAALAVVAVGILVAFGGAKPARWQITWDGGIKDDPSRGCSYATNSVLHLVWQRDTRGGVYIPESAAVYIDYRPIAATNEEWGTLAQSVVGAWGIDVPVEDATNYNYHVWGYYIPPEPVHTNGVWIYKTLKDRHQRHPLPLRSRIEIDGKAIATPAEKRKDDER